MERTWRVIQIAGLLALGGWWFGLARADEQSQPKQAPSIRIAVIDMVRLFNAYPRFHELRDDLKLRIEIATAEMGARAEAVAKMRSDWKALPFGNPERKTLDAEISKATAKIEADKAYLQADFFQREASMYSACYHDVRAEVDRYSKAHGIQLVLRSSELEPEDKRDDPVKLKEWLESLFIEHANLDITDEILAALRR